MLLVLTLLSVLRRKDRYWWKKECFATLKVCSVFSACCRLAMTSQCLGAQLPSSAESLARLNASVFIRAFYCLAMMLTYWDSAAAIRWETGETEMPGHYHRSVTRIRFCGNVCWHTGNNCEHLWLLLYVHVQTTHIWRQHIVDDTSNDITSKNST